MPSNSYYNNTALGGTVALAASGPIKLTGYHLFNTSSAAAYVQLFDASTTADVTIGTTAPSVVMGLPASGGAVMAVGEDGIRFQNGMVVASTTTVNGTTTQTTVVTLFFRRQ